MAGRFSKCAPDTGWRWTVGGPANLWLGCKATRARSINMIVGKIYQPELEFSKSAIDCCRLVFRPWLNRLETVFQSRLALRGAEHLQESMDKDHSDDDHGAQHSQEHGCGADSERGFRRFFKMMTHAL